MSLKMKYFVLKPQGSDDHAAASRAAMGQYANYIERSDPEMAKQLREWRDDEHARAYVLRKGD